MERKHVTAAPDRYDLLKEFARHNRREMTKTETILWNVLRSEFRGLKFRRQHPIGDYIADFLSLSEKLVIEVDGGYHNTAEQREADANRSEELARIGFEVIRFSNEEVFLNINNVLNRIKDRLLENDS